MESMEWSKGTSERQKCLEVIYESLPDPFICGRQKLNWIWWWKWWILMLIRKWSLIFRTLFWFWYCNIFQGSSKCKQTESEVLYLNIQLENVYMKGALKSNWLNLKKKKNIYMALTLGLVRCNSFQISVLFGRVKINLKL